MPLNNAAMVIGATAVRAAITHLQSHSGDPGGSGTANPTTGPRQPSTFTQPSNDGDFGLAAPVDFTGIAANGAVQYVSAWSGLTGGNWYGNFAVTGDATANSAGEYTLTALTLNGLAS